MQSHAATVVTVITAIGFQGDLVHVCRVSSMVFVEPAHDS